MSDGESDGEIRVRATLTDEAGYTMGYTISEFDSFDAAADFARWLQREHVRLRTEWERPGARGQGDPMVAQSARRRRAELRVIRAAQRTAAQIRKAYAGVVSADLIPDERALYAAVAHYEAITEECRP